MKTIEYLFPLTKRGRLLLKLKQLFDDLESCLKQRSFYGLKGILQSVVDILLLLERVDIKTEVKKEMEKLLPGELAWEDQELFQQKGRFGENIRSQPLFSMLQKRLSQPGGLGSFDMPSVYTWLHREEEEQNSLLKKILEELYPLKQSLKKIFDLYSLHKKQEEKTALNGFIKITPKTQSTLAFVELPAEHSLLTPEVSSSLQALVIKFWHYQELLEKPAPSDQSFQFNYAEV